MTKPIYIHLTPTETHAALYAALRPIKALKASKRAYVQQITADKCAVYLQDDNSADLRALWVHIESNYKKTCDVVYLLPYQHKTRGKVDPLYYFKINYFDRGHLIDWLKSFDLQVYYAAGTGTSFWAVDDN